MKTLIIIPAYNEELNILNTVQELRELVEKSESQILRNIDMLVVNDASTDGTEQLLLDHQIPHITLPINLGIGGGVQAGYLYALQNGYDVAVQMDGDGQHKASELEKILEPLYLDEADLVVGSRFVTGEGFQSSFARRLGIRFLSSLIRVCAGVKVKDVTSGFRGVNARYIQVYAKDYAQDYPEPEALVTAGKLKGRVKEVPVIMRERAGGQSSISAVKSIYYMLKVSLAIIIKSIGR